MGIKEGDIQKEMAALAFAKVEHGSQKRKYSFEPYYHHLIEVAAFVRSVTHDSNMICAAFLHDTIEDCHVHFSQIEAEFGLDVAHLVEQLTDRSRPEDGNRETRKRLDREAYANATTRAQTIKLADLISNTASITVCDPGFAKVYMKEKKLLLPYLRQGHKTLYELAMDQLFRWTIKEKHGDV